jgi:hypothetical protein
MTQLNPAEILMSKHAVRLAELSKRMQLSSATINATLEVVETKLKELNLGVEATAELTVDWVFGYGKVENHKWCLFMQSREAGVIASGRTPIKLCSRQQKVRCLVTLPKILDAVVEASEAMVKELDDANAQVESFVRDMQQQ